MNLYFRFFWVMLCNLFRKKFVPPLTEIRTDFRVLLNDLDLNQHMNNGRYLTIMDLGRFDYLGKTGLLKTCIKNRWFPILGATQMVFLRPLKLFQKYTIYTSVECWDDKWFIIKQRFVSNEKVVAIGKIRGLLRGSQGNIRPSEVFKSSQTAEVDSPAPSSATKLWLESMSISNM
jgi:acyl-CoA thioesterase FadM